MIMQRQSDGTYSQIGFIRTPTEDIEQIVDKNGNVYFTKGFSRQVSGYPATLPDSISKPLLEYKVYGNIQQNGTPTPENPVDVLGVGNKTDNGYEIPVVSRGKNLFDFKTMSGDTKGYLNEAGNIVTTNDWEITDFIPCCGRIFTINKIGGTKPAICLYDKNKEFITSKRYDTVGANDKKSITIESETVAYYIRFSYYISSQSYDNLEYIQLELGSEVTEYEPYHEPVTTSILLDKPLYKGDYITKDKSGGKVYRAWGVKVFDGTENWNLWSANLSETERYTCTLPAPCGTLTLSRCNCFTYSGGNEDFEHFRFSNTIDDGIAIFNTFVLFVEKNKASDVNSLKAWFKQQYDAGTPVTLYYPLAEPTEESIELPEIPTFDGTTIIEIDTEISPENIEITYKSRR